jgi:hypothetical protein
MNHFIVSVVIIAAGVCMLVALLDEPNAHALMNNAGKAVIASAIVRSTAFIIGGLLLALAGILEN